MNFLGSLCLRRHRYLSQSMECRRQSSGSTHPSHAHSNSQSLCFLEQTNQPSMKRSLQSLGQWRGRLTSGTNAGRIPATTTTTKISLTLEASSTRSSKSTCREMSGQSAEAREAFSPSSKVYVTQIQPQQLTPPSHLLSPADVTQLVDNLLESTRTIMDGSSKHIVAFSGGIDSSVVAALVHQSFIPERETVHAVLGLSPAVSSEQVDLAEEVAHFIGIDFQKLPTPEGTDATYIENSGQACLACKTHLYTCLETIVAHQRQMEQDQGQHQQQQPQPPHHNGVDSFRIYNGTNADDLQDPTRLGLIAADRFDVRSPLRGITKEEVRMVGKHLGLPNWNYAASPCLRSRLAIGVEAIPDHLAKIEAAERYVRTSLALDATHNLRVRLLTKNRAMVEVEEGQLESAEEALGGWKTYFCEDLDFSSVDVRCFRTGSVAQVVTPTYSSTPPNLNAATDVATA